MLDIAMADSKLKLSVHYLLANLSFAVCYSVLVHCPAFISKRFYREGKRFYREVEKDSDFNYIILNNPANSSRVISAEQSLGLLRLHS